MIWLLFVGLKVLHEFGHAYACRLRGGEVPEMGVYLIAGTPCAYSWRQWRPSRQMSSCSFEP